MAVKDMDNDGDIDIITPGQIGALLVRKSADYEVTSSRTPSISLPNHNTKFVVRRCLVSSQVHIKRVAGFQSEPVPRSRLMTNTTRL